MEKEIVLYPHNELAYQKLVDKLQTNNMVSINHATGTGKSFIILKYLYQNKDKRILILAPTYQILEQFINVHSKEIGINISEFQHLDSKIYCNLDFADARKIADNYDIIILDEYHRCGAPKWGIVINELKRILQEEKKNVKVVGTTATEIRYLDNQKDMNDVLFDGVNASTLTLTDAILDGILPVFEYVISPLGILSSLDVLEKRINRIVLYDDIKAKSIAQLDGIRDEIKVLMEKQVDYKNFFANPKKCLVFSSTIDKMQDDASEVYKIIKTTKVRNYQISCRNTTKVNEGILNEFRKKDDVTKLLFSVNLLNEGVHVKDVDSVFMFRKTVSPRIYFQQLGRLLSCSKNADKLIIFDFVDNIANNNVVYTLYEEVVSEAKRRYEIETDIEKKQRYLHIINTFKIVNIFSSVSEKLDQLKKELSIPKLITFNLERAVSNLKQVNFNSYEFYFNLSVVFRYQKYLTFNQFEILKTVGINQIPILQLSIDEFKQMLDGYENISERQRNYYARFEQKILDYYETNNNLPSIFDTDDESKKLAKELMFKFDLFSEEFIDKVKVMVSENMSVIEKVSYGININESDYEQLYKDIDYFIKYRIFISENVTKLLHLRLDSKSSRYINLILQNNAETIEIEKEENKLIRDLEKFNIEKDGEQISRNRLFTVESLEIIKSCYQEYELNKEEYIQKVYNNLMAYINMCGALPRLNEGNMKIYLQYFLFKQDLINAGYYQKIQDTLLHNKQIIERQRKRKYYFKR